MLEALIGGEIRPSEAESVLASARTLAPGLSIRCIGSTGGVDLSGLVGLLLSAATTESDNLGGLLLALDQHRDLLSGRGQLSDLLRIRMIEKDVCIDVVEAKFSTGTISLKSSAVTEAQPSSLYQRSAGAVLSGAPSDLANAVAPCASNRTQDPLGRISRGSREALEGTPRSCARPSSQKF
jgi:hypothetical protein